MPDQKDPKSQTRRILIVADEVEIETTLRPMLEECGYAVAASSSLADSLNRIRKHRFDLVLVDMSQSTIKGSGICDLATERVSDVALILLAEKDRLHGFNTVLDEGLHAQIIKPLNPQEAKAVIVNVLRQQKLSRENKRLAAALRKANRALATANRRLSGESEERRQLGEKIRLLSCAVEQSSEGMAVTDLQGTLLFVNNAYATMHGYTPLDDLVGRPRSIFHTAEQMVMVREAKRQTEKTGEFIGEIGHVRKDGTTFPTFMHIALLKDEAGNPVGCIATATNITELRSKIEEAARARAYSEGMFKSMIDGFCVISLDGTVVDANQAFLDMFMVERDAFIGLPLERLLSVLVPEELQVAILSRFERAKAEAVSTSMEMPLTVRDGKEIIVSEVNTLVRNAHGTPEAVFAVFRDVTARRQMEREIRERNQQLDAQNEQLQRQHRELMCQRQELLEKTHELEAASTAKSTFLAHMSHELRTPLNAILGFSELMLDSIPGEINDEQRQCLEDIFNSGQHLLALINDVLDLSKVEAGRMDFKLESLDLIDVVQGLVQTMRPLLEDKKHTISIRAEEGLPHVRADKSRLRQILLNLLGNAVNFTAPGGCLAVDARQAGDWCEVSVSDNGIGISPEDQPRVFDVFTQAVTLPSVKKRGTGLGLALTKQLIEETHGRIWVQSELGKGSTFTFTLPLDRVPIEQ